MEVEVIGQMDNTIDHTFESANRVYDVGGLSPTINTCGGGGLQPKIIVAMRGRNPENPNSRQAGLPTEQRLEPNLKGISNTLTSVQKDNLVLEGICTNGKPIDIASTILAGYERTNMTGFNADNGVLETYYLSEKGKKYVCDPKGGMCTDINADICQTLTAKGQSNWTGSFVSEDIDRLEKDTTIGSNEPTKIHLKNGMQITSDDDLKAYRIRKLTPKECWRLMGFTDEDFEKAAEVNSNTQLYKQAGNSIVKDVLMAIFKQMLPYEERQIDGIGKQVMVDMAVEEDKEKMPF